jgi:hypothetical protein
MVQFKSSEPASDYLFRTTRRAPPWRLGVKLASRAFIHADDFGSRACTEAHTEIEQIDFPARPRQRRTAGKYADRGRDPDAHPVTALHACACRRHETDTAALDDGLPGLSTKETPMKSLLLVLAALTPGCVVVPYDNYRPPRGGAYMDRDGDGVPDRHDRRPNNPYRY